MGLEKAFWTNKPCLVTGGAGFGGAHLCEQLLARGAKVYVLDKLCPSNSYLAMGDLSSRVDEIVGDIRDFDFVRLLLERLEIDTVFHLAAQPIVPMSNVLPLETLSVNAMGTYTLLEACRTVSCADRFVFASSGAYYGTTTNEACLCESDVPLTATNIYAPSKVAGDLVVRCYARIYGLKAATCRFMNTYGPGDTNFSRLVPRAARNLLSGGEYDFGSRDDGTTRLDFLHIRDMAGAYIHVAERLEDVAGEAFNFGAGTPTCVADVARQASISFDGRAREPQFRGRPFETKIIKTLDIAKAERVLGWKPQTSLQDGLDETMAWYRDNWGRL